MSDSSPREALNPSIVASVYLGAIALWMGGLATLGAIVAPTVFRVVAAPANADAMTTVFRRFDTLALACAVVALACEVGLRARQTSKPREDLARLLSVAGAAGVAVLEALWLSPGIDALHKAGAVRRIGAAGEALERLHRVAESFAKLELLLLALVLVLVVRRVARRSTLAHSVREK